MSTTESDLWQYWCNVEGTRVWPGGYIFENKFQTQNQTIWLVELCANQVAWAWDLRKGFSRYKAKNLLTPLKTLQNYKADPLNTCIWRTEIDKTLCRAFERCKRWIWKTEIDDTLGRIIDNTNDMLWRSNYTTHWIELLNNAIDVIGGPNWTTHWVVLLNETNYEIGDPNIDYILGRGSERHQGWAWMIEIEPKQMHHRVELLDEIVGTLGRTSERRQWLA